jgi:hypothetical protein
MLIGQCSGITLSACMSACISGADEITVFTCITSETRILVVAKLAALKNSGNQKHSSRQIIFFMRYDLNSSFKDNPEYKPIEVWMQTFGSRNSVKQAIAI